MTEQTNCLKKYMYHTCAHIHRCSEMDKIRSVVLINAVRSCSKLKEYLRTSYLRRFYNQSFIPVRKSEYHTFTCNPRSPPPMETKSQKASVMRNDRIAKLRSIEPQRLRQFMTVDVSFRSVAVFAAYGRIGHSTPMPIATRDTHNRRFAPIAQHGHWINERLTFNAVEAHGRIQSDAKAQTNHSMLSSLSIGAHQVSMSQPSSPELSY